MIKRYLFIILLFTCSFVYAELPITNQQQGADENTLLLYHCNEDDDNVVNDNSGNQNNGTSNNTVVVEGVFDDALDFNGSSSYVDVPAGASVRGLSGATMSVWFYSRGAVVIHQALYHESRNTFPDYAKFSLYIRSDTNKYECGVRSPDSGTSYYSTSVSTYAENVWINFVVSVDIANNKVKMYENGERIEVDENVSWPGSAFSDVAPATIMVGRLPSGSNYYFNGYIEELKIHGRVLTDAEVRFNYQRQSGASQ